MFSRKLIRIINFIYSPNCVSTIHFVSNVAVFLGAGLSVISATGFLWDTHSEHKKLSDFLSGSAAILTMFSAMTLYWSGRQQDKRSKKKERAVNLQISRSAEKIEMHKADIEKYKYKLEKIRNQLAWRHVTPQQEEILRKLLRGSEVEVWLSFVKSDAECVLFRQKINSALEGTCIKTKFYSGYERAIGLGIRGDFTDDLEKVYQAFKSAGFAIEYYGTETTFTPIEILVGSKPAPEID